MSTTDTDEGTTARRDARRPRRFSPARLLLGLALLAIAPVHLADALRDGLVDRSVLLGLLPAALLLAGGVAVLTRLVRLLRDRPPAR